MRNHNHIMSSADFLSFICYMIISLSLTAAQVERCYKTGNFTADSTYATNRNLTLLSLASNVTIKGGYYTTTVGKTPDRVYGLVLCRGDITSEACTNCVATAIQNINTKCPNEKEVISWGGDPPCIVRYSNRSFLGILELDPISAGYNVGSLTGTFITDFMMIWKNLMDRTVKRASADSSRLIKFATGEANMTIFTSIYTLMFCTPDMSQSDCDICLRASVSYFQSCCNNSQGGYVQRPNCVFRWDIYPFYDIPISHAPSPSSKGIPNTPFPRNHHDNGVVSSKIVLAIILSSIVFVALVIFAFVLLYRRKRKIGLKSKQNMEDFDGIDAIELQFEFRTIRAATNNFSIENKLGQGGFGTVYKGRLPDGQDIAVKRLSSNSGQGEHEFKNEVLLVAKLQHKNLAKLLGFCLEGSERLLIYEFMPNSSLDTFIFDLVKRPTLNWEMRYKIISGIARGLLYLHEDSRLRIVHRDLKASNILLDANMDAKISDFGMAKLFDMDQTQGDTRRIVGTFGYMAPEYLRRGHYSGKSDVFSFGVLLLEIISGQKNSNFHNGEEEADLVAYAWKNWREEASLNLVDPTLLGSRNEMMRCIHIGLLCVQENIANRPTMASVVHMLTSVTTSLPVPSKPAFLVTSRYDLSAANKQSEIHSVNEVSITDLDPR